MFSTQTAVAGLAAGRSKRDEETSRDVWREQLYNDMNAIQRQVDACQLSPAEGVRQQQALVAAYYAACDAFKNRAVSQSCRNYETQDYPGGAQQGAFVTRRNRIAAAGANCGKTSPIVGPVTVGPAVVPLPIVQLPSGPMGSSPGGCCGYTPSGGGLSIGLDGGIVVNGGGPVGLTTGGHTGGGIIGAIGKAVDGAVHGGDSVYAGANGGGYGVGGGRDIATSSAQVIDFPMRNAYNPIAMTGAPVAGLTAWPSRDDISLPGVRISTFNDGQSNVRGAQSMNGFGYEAPTIQGGTIDGGTVYASDTSFPQGIHLPSSSPSILQSILGTIQTILPATISAIKGKPYYDTAPQGITGQFQTGLSQQQLAPSSGQDIAGTGANVGSNIGAGLGGLVQSLTNIVTQNPLLVAGAAFGIFLLMREPPRRGR